MVIEISFPRGGKKPPIHKTAQVSKVRYDLFGKKKQKHKNRDTRNEMGPKNFVEQKVCPKEIVQTSAKLLSYDAIQEGVIVMGCIREIQKMTLSVLLPGRISGKVMITQISTPYTKLLQALASNKTPDEYKPIKDLFYPGQYVATKIISCNNSKNDKIKLNLSMNPHDINSVLTYKSVVAGMLLWGAVSSCEEYGYVIDLGIKNCRAFLPKINVENNKIYSIGEVLWCVVQKMEITNVVSTITLNALNKKIESTKLIKETSLDYILPGMQVDITISKLLKNGFECKYLDDFKAYVHESFLETSFEKLNNYKVDQVVTARVLYITPITKLACLTLRGFKKNDSEIAEGTILNAFVHSVTKGGLYLKLNKMQKGFVSYRRLSKKFSLNIDLDYKDVVMKDYPIGSQHQCRILNYDRLEDLYICTMEKTLLKEKIFTYYDTKIGDDITVQIKDIEKNGLLIQAGRLEGYILNEHLSDAVLPNYNIIKSKFHIGQKLKAKVWNVNTENNNLHLTLKPAFLNAVENLTSYEKAIHNKQYPGYVVQVTKNGILVAFFGNVKGWVPKNQLSFEKVLRPELMFKIGQIVMCTIIKCTSQSQKLSLSLHPPKAESYRKKLRMGQHVRVMVKNITSTSLEVEVITTRVGAVIPMQFLTSNSSLASLLLSTYSVGDIIDDVVCINTGRGIPFLSLRDLSLTEEIIPDFKNLKPDLILHCNVNSINKKCMLLQSPIKDFSKLIVVPLENICEIEKQTSLLDIQKYQSIYARLTNVNLKNENVHGTTELSKCWDGDLSSGYKLIKSYLSDIKRINSHFIKNHKTISEYRQGQIVEGIVKLRMENGYTLINIKRDDDIKIIGHIHTKHSISGLKV